MLRTRLSRAMTDERIGEASDRILRERFWSQTTPPSEATVVDLAAWRALSATTQR